MSQQWFDLLVIGAGPGGYVAAIRAAQLGMQVGCIEKESLGGTCLNVGCIPSKALLESSELLHQAQTLFGRHGIQTEGIGFNLDLMMNRKNKIINNMTGGISNLFRKNNVKQIVGTAQVINSGLIEVENSGIKERFKTDRILIATGSKPVEIPSLPFDGKFILNSTDALELSEVPERLVVIGAGSVGLELGSVWGRLGAEVLMIEVLGHILPGMDKEMGAQLKRLLEKQGFTFLLETRVEAMEICNGEVNLTLNFGFEFQEHVCDCVLVAVGRHPHTSGLGVKEAGIELDEVGRIKVDEQYETSLPRVYAIGDVIAGPMLAHKAEEEGIAAVELMAEIGGNVNYDTIPHVVYTNPELASVGMTEEEAKNKGIGIRVGKFPFLANGRAQSLEATDGLVKVISDSETDRLLGMHILGVRASDLLAEGVVALEFSASSEDLARIVHAHPTLPEAVKEAALAVENRAIHF